MKNAIRDGSCGYSDNNRLEMLPHSYPAMTDAIVSQGGIMAHDGGHGRVPMRQRCRCIKLLCAVKYAIEHRSFLLLAFERSGAVELLQDTLDRPRREIS